MPKTFEHSRPALRPARPPRPGRTRLAIGLGMLAASLIILLPGHAVAQDAPRTSFTATASARLMSVELALSPPILITPLFDGGHAVAQAQVDSLGTSSAFAGGPYPGSSVIGLPALIGTLTQGEIGEEQFPDFPTYVSSSHPTQPEERRELGAIVLEAASSTGSSSSRATDGATAGRATTSSDSQSGDVTAFAESSIASLRLGEDLTLHGVRSSAEATKSPSEELERSSTFEITALTIMGQRVAVTPEALEAGDAEVPLGGGGGGVLGPLLSALADEGITIEPFPAEEFEDGISSAGLRITMPVSPPSDLASGIETVTATITVGGNLATVGNQALPDFGGGIAPVPTTGGGDLGGAAPPPASPPAPASSSVPTAPDSQPAPTTDPGEVAAPTAPATVPASSGASIPVDISVFRFYPIIALAGAVLFVAARLFSPLGGTTS